MISKYFFVAALLAVTLVLGTTGTTHAQTLPDVLNEGTIEEQYDYLHERTNIYNNFRAIREDMFQKVRRNSVDSIQSLYHNIGNLQTAIDDMQERQDSMQVVMAEATSERDIAIRDRDSLFLLGMPMSKTYYNTLLWSIIGILVFGLIMVAVLYNRARIITNQTRKDFKDLQFEFEEYRKSSRERFERQAIDHFNEVKRLKGI